jgi:N-acetylmuramoyl-L-alanine amidase
MLLVATGDQVMKRQNSVRRGRRLGASVVLVALLVVLIAVILVMGRHGADGSRLTEKIVRSRKSVDDGAPLDPSYFAPGACVAFAPTGGDNGKTVFLDAGHGGIDPGGVGTTQAGQTVYESDVNLPIVLDTMALLRSRGYRVVVSRTADTTVLGLHADDTDEGTLSELGTHDDVAARDVCANLARADLLVGLYMDAGGSPDDAGSVTIYDPDRPFSPASAKFANLLQTDVLSVMDSQSWEIPNDGVQPDSGFGSLVGDPSTSALSEKAANYNHLMLIGPGEIGYFSTPSQMPGAVIEPLYLSDPFEGTIAVSTDDQQIISQGIATAVEQYFAPISSASGARTSLRSRRR